MKRKLLSGLLLALLLLPGCGNGTADDSSTTTESSDTTRLSALFSDRDLDPPYDETDSTAKATLSPATTPPKITTASSSAARISARAAVIPSATAAQVRTSPWTASSMALAPA